MFGIFIVVSFAVLGASIMVDLQKSDHLKDIEE